MKKKYIYIILLMSIWNINTLNAQNLLEEVKQRIKLSGKATIRLYEADFNQETINGELDDRHRNRYNLYLNLSAKISERIQFNGRLRTGQTQFEWITFGQNTEERFNIILDKLNLEYKYKNSWVRVGRQSAIWTHQKGALFDVPTHDGISAGTAIETSSLNIQPQLAYFNEGHRDNTDFSRQGKLYGGEIKIETKKEKGFNIDYAVGLLLADHLPNRYVNFAADPSGNQAPVYHEGDLASEYRILSNGIGITFKKLHNLSFRGDFYYNFKNYKRNPFSHQILDNNGVANIDGNQDVNSTPDFTDQNKGYVITAQIGKLENKGDWYLGATYLYMEKYAALDFFAQYDYTRWASTNIKGPEFKAGYQINKYLKAQTRLFLVEEIKGYDGANPDFLRKGNRFRIDLNISI